MKVRALRGVCIGVNRHLVPGDPAIDLEPALVSYLTSIGAVELVPEKEAKPEPAIVVDPEPLAKAGKKQEK